MNLLNLFQMYTPASIKGRLVLTLIAAAVIPTVCISAFMFMISREQFLEAEYQKIDSVGHEVVSRVQSFMRDAVNQTEVLALDSRLIGEDGEERSQRILDAKQYFTVFDDLSLYSPMGELLFSTREKHVEQTEQSYGFKQASTGTTWSTPPRFIMGVEGFISTIYTPVFNSDKEVRNILVSQVRFDMIWDVLDAVKLGNNGLVVLLDEHGNLLAHPNKNRILRKLNARHHARTENSPNVVTDIDGQTYLGVVEHISPEMTRLSQSWELMCLRPYAEVVAPLRERQNLEFAILLGTLLCVIAFGTLLGNRITKPIVRAAEAAQQVAQGKRVTLSENGPLEMRKLAEGFNYMVEQVQKHKNELGKLVEQRTANLMKSTQAFQDLAVRLKASYEALDQGLLMVGLPENNVVECNGKIADIFDLPAIEIEGLTADALFFQLSGKLQENSSFAVAWKKVLDYPNEEIPMNYELRTADNKILSVYTSPVTDDSGCMIARLWKFDDVTNEHRLESELRHSQKMEAVGRLAGGIAHDFNNLLTIILGNIEFVRCEVKPGSPLIADLDESITSVQRASRLTRQLLTVGRRQPSELEPTDINEVIRGIDDMLQRSVDVNTKLTHNLASGLPSAMANSGQFEQIILNLVINASHSMPHGGDIRVSSRLIQEQLPHDNHIRDYIQVLCSDTGSGMPSSVRERIFEPYFTTKESGKGTGLGLASVYGIVQQHEGDIRCDSVVGMGTTFSILIPTTQEASQKVDQKKVTQPHEGEGKTVLIAEDEPEVLRLTARMLQNMGYKVLEAEGPNEALKIARTYPDRIDLVLSDVVMPDLTGPEMVEELKLIRSDFCVQYMTGYTNLVQNDEGPSLQQSLLKPFTRVDLSSAVQRQLHKSTGGDAIKITPAKANRVSLNPHRSRGA